MLKRIFLFMSMIAALAAFLVPWQAFAQGNLTLSAMEVDLWPEYDQPAVLVIYRVTLPATLTLPAELKFRIPAAAGEPSAVAVKQNSSTGESGLFSIEYQRNVVGDWGEITLQATGPELQIEYYDPALLKQGAARQYAYTWPGDYAVGAFSLQVQQPTGATDMKISPASGSGVTGQDGLVYFNKQVGAMPAGQTLSVSLSYNKTTDTLSATNLQVQPGAPVGGVTSTQFDWQSILPWVLGVLGVGLIVGGGFWYWQSGRNKPAGAPARQRHRPSSETREAGGTSEGHIYCHQCGKRAAAGDRFCRMCGTPLRGE
jgi:hypothetical protein